MGRCPTSSRGRLLLFSCHIRFSLPCAAAKGREGSDGGMASVYIPVQGTEEEVRVALDHLPADASDILDILKAEQAPLHLWLIIAVGPLRSQESKLPLQPHLGLGLGRRRRG